MDRPRIPLGITPVRATCALIVPFLAVIGVAGASEQQVLLWGCIVGSVIGLTCIAFRRSRDSGKYVSLIMCGMLLALGTLRFHTQTGAAQIPATLYHQKSMTLTGTVRDQPDQRFDRMLYTVALSGTATGNVLVTDVAMWPRFSQGDHLRIVGALTQPTSSSDFDYAAYLARFDVAALVRAQHIERTRSASPSLSGTLYAIRSFFESRINLLLPEPSAGLLAGLLTGDRGGMSPQLNQAFQQTGLTHITAVSGSNITIVIAALSAFLFFLPLRWRLVPLGIGIVAFAILTGAGASVVRAAIMGGIGLVALHTGRMAHAWMAILWTAFMMLLWNPLLLRDDVGFQLSFASVIGLHALGPHFKAYLAHVPDVWGLRETLAMTLAAQVFATPVVLLQFGNFSVISPVSNVLVAPFIPLSMFWGFLATAVSLVSQPLGQLLALVAGGCLQIIVGIATFFSSLPFTSFVVPRPPLTVCLLYYGLLIYVLWRQSQKTHPEKEAVLRSVS